jgi:pimeloyl-ACP methyl ester carboxylesterase
MATFILIHGTWTKSARWPGLREGLALAASEGGERSRFEELRWSGANKTSARQGAASDILSLVQKIRSASIDEKIFIIGHSHGGSAIAYFLKQHATLAKALSGCAFLSTPFIAIRPKPEAVTVFYGLGIVLAVCFSTLYPYYYVQLFGGDFISDAPLLYPSWLVILAAFAWFILRTGHEFEKPDHILNQIRKSQTADELPTGNYLFLRCSGDEAAAGLSAVQLIAWANLEVSQFLALITRWILASKVLKGICWIWLVLIFGWWTSFSTAEMRDVMIDIYKNAGQGNLALTIIFSALIWSFWATHILVIVGALGALVIFLAQAITSRLFGWTGLSTGFFVELAIEPLPFGVNSMTHIDWSVNPLRLQGMTHSWTYADPGAIQSLRTWVKSALQHAQ